MSYATEKKIQNFFSENLLIAILPVVAYGVAFFFEVGYLRAFDLPQFLITITLEKFLSCASILFIILALILGIFDTIGMVVPKSFLKKLPIIFPLFAYGIFLISVISNYEQAENNLIYFALIFMVTIYLMLLYSFAFFKSKNENIQYSDAFRVVLKPTVEEEKKSFLNVLFRKIGVNNILYILILFLFIPLIAQGFGFLSAQGRGEFLIMNEKGKDYALIRSYSDLFIYVEIEKERVGDDKFAYKFGKNYVLMNPQPSSVIHKKEYVSKI